MISCEPDDTPVLLLGSPDPPQSDDDVEGSVSLSGSSGEDWADASGFGLVDWAEIGGWNTLVENLRSEYTGGTEDVSNKN